MRCEMNTTFSKAQYTEVVRETSEYPNEALSEFSGAVMSICRISYFVLVNAGAWRGNGPQRSEVG